MEVIESKWEKLLELAAKRKLTLAGSVELHKYHRYVAIPSCLGLAASYHGYHAYNG